jgi:hypothetical protein
MTSTITKEYLTFLKEAVDPDFLIGNSLVCNLNECEETIKYYTRNPRCPSRARCNRCGMQGHYTKFCINKTYWANRMYKCGCHPRDIKVRRSELSAQWRRNGSPGENPIRFGTHCCLCKDPHKITDMEPSDNKLRVRCNKCKHQTQQSDQQVTPPPAPIKEKEKVLKTYDPIEQLESTPIINEEIIIAGECSNSGQILSNSEIDEWDRKDPGQPEAMDIHQDFWQDKGKGKQIELPDEITFVISEIPDPDREDVPQNLLNYCTCAYKKARKPGYEKIDTQSGKNPFPKYLLLDDRRPNVECSYHYYEEHETCACYTKYIKYCGLHNYHDTFYRDPVNNCINCVKEGTNRTLIQRNFAGGCPYCENYRPHRHYYCLIHKSYRDINYCLSCEFDKNKWQEEMLTQVVTNVQGSFELLPATRQERDVYQVIERLSQQIIKKNDADPGNQEKYDSLSYLDIDYPKRLPGKDYLTQENQFQKKTDTGPTFAN